MVVYDLAVIGAGSGGLAAAERAAAYGARVAIAESADVGGACVNYGCIPEKLLDVAAGFRQQHAFATAYGWTDCDRQFNWSHFIQAKDQHLQRLHDLHLQHLQQANVTFIPGQAAFLDAHTLMIGGQSVTADKILIAVGAKPTRLTLPGIEHTITWRELYYLPEQPKQMAIVGDDNLGVKIAGSMNALGTQVTQIIPQNSILPQLDAELAGVIQNGSVAKTF